ncbi:hypothetical protein [Cerasicoccus frondis]|uniref:hypothetical protein n=1 Tax=Cerasicoccus frondis TaxID=490090 RepID=UPI0028528B45|nr:hypothetical protein [Cerasicoccus frondis]
MPTPKSDKIRIAIVLFVILGASIRFLYYSNTPLAKEDTAPNQEPSETFVESHAGTTATRSNSRFSSTTNSGNLDIVRFDRIDLRTDGSMLAENVATRMQEALQTASPHTVVTILTYNEWPEPGSRLPNAIFTIGIEDTSTTAGALEQEQAVTATLQGGAQPYNSNNTLRDRLTPPVLRWTVDGSVDVKQRFEGVSVDRNFSDSMADNITESFVDHITKQMQTLQDKASDQSATIELPDYFYPAFHNEPMPEAFAPYQPELMLSGHGLLLPNETYWRLTVPAGATFPLKQISEALQDKAWKESSYREGDPNEIPILRLTQEYAEKLEVWPMDRSLESTEPSTTDREYIARYIRRLTQDQYRAIASQAFADEQPVAVLMMLNPWWAKDDQRTFAERALTNANALSPIALITVAETLEKQGRADEAMSLMPRIYLLNEIENANLDSRMEKLGQAATGDQNWAPEFPTLTKLEANGVPTIANDGSATQTIPLNGYAFTAIDREGETHVAFVRIQPDTEDATGEYIQVMNGELHAGSSFWGEGSFSAKQLHAGEDFGGTHNGVETTQRVTMLDPETFEVTYINGPLPEASNTLTQ